MDAGGILRKIDFYYTRNDFGAGKIDNGTFSKSVSASISITRVSPIRAVMGFSAMADANLVVLANAVLKALTGNASFPNPTVPLTTFGNDITAYGPMAPVPPVAAGPTPSSTPASAGATAGAGPGAAPSSWTILNVANIKKPIAIDNLTSGTLYAFQLQALGMKGLSAWSDSSTIMCP